MHTEIGSEFWDVPQTEKENDLFKDATWFVSGRAAFRKILQTIELENRGVHQLKAALPSYLCESMIEPLKIEGIEYKFYQVFFKDGRFQCDCSNIEDCNIILVIDYFGYESFDNPFPASNKIIIRDLTHSIFTKKYDDADYYFGSLRKWAGFLCGGFAWKKNGSIDKPTDQLSEYISLRKKAMDLKKDYLSGKGCKDKFRQAFLDAEKLLDDCKIAMSGNSDQKLASHMDIDFLKKTRRDNAKVLIEGLLDLSLMNSLGPNDCPLFVPIATKKRNELRRHLIDSGIYCPIHWPKPFNDQCKSDKLYEEELSLVCDQRYSVRDMKRIVSSVRAFMEKEKNA